jgi:hypothetical protein
MKPLLLAFLLSFPLVTLGAECRVADPELQGTYEGGCSGGLADGYGIARGEAQYEGGFRKGLKHGQGVKTWSWGDRYEGGFRDDRRHGKGTYVWGAQSPWAGERFEGDYVADQREGLGVYYWPNGDRFEGQWKADRRYGYSAMEIRRQAAQKARAEALTAGTRVCAWGKVGIAHSVLRVGQVKSVAENSLEVVLLKTEGPEEIVGAGGPQAGETVTGDLAEWTPCL